jgi:hypothetical protein
MSTYPLKNGDVLVFSVDQGPWETIKFRSRDFKKKGAATAAEVAAVVKRSKSLHAVVDAGALVLETAERGAHVALEIDVARSTAAPALGVSATRARVSGTGMQAARLVGLAREPFALARGSAMTLHVDGKKRAVVFDKKITAGRATAAEVADAVNAHHARLARATRDGRVMLTSPTLGDESTLRVEPAPAGTPDAAGVLGLVGAAAASWPHRTEPARIACAAAANTLQLQNLTAGPVELHLRQGTTVLPGRASVVLDPQDAGQAALQRLIQQGVVRLAPVTGR